MCSHVYLLPFQCRLVWPGVSPLLDLSTCVLLTEGVWWMTLVCFSYIYIYQNGITGLTSQPQMRSNYPLKDKCVSYTWVNLTPLVIETKIKKRKTGGRAHHMSSNQYSHLVWPWGTSLALASLLSGGGDSKRTSLVHLTPEQQGKTLSRTRRIWRDPAAGRRGRGGGQALSLPVHVLQIWMKWVRGSERLETLGVG